MSYQQETCIICLEDKDLVFNVRCRCTYWYHTECMNHIQNTQCPICRADVGPLYIEIQDVAPVTAPTSTPAPAQQQPQQQQLPPIPIQSRIIHTLLLCAIIAVIVIILKLLIE